MPNTRDCKSCHLIKLISEFPQSKGRGARADGLSSYCRECKNAKSREFRANRKRVDWKGRRIYTKDSIVCEIEGCDGPAKMVSRTLCSKHYARLKRHGSVDPDLRAPNGTGHVTENGYRVIYQIGHPNANPRGQIYEHRYVMSEWLGRPLAMDENVHHRNGDRSDNRVDNLELWVKTQPPGQRVLDRLKDARNLIERYEQEEFLL